MTGRLAAAGALMLLAGPMAAQEPRDPARAFLAESFDLTSADLDRVAAGQVVSRTLDARDSREVATIGVMRVEVPPAFYAARLADITTFKKDEAILQVGRFSHPPRLQDMADLTLDDGDVRGLQRCRVGDCGMQLSAEAIARFRDEVSWGAADASGQADGLMRDILVDYVAGYMRSGDAASMRYADRDRPVDLAQEFASLIEPDVGGLHRFPALHRHLLEYPAGRTPGVQDVIYWSKEKVARKEVVSVTHLAIWRAAEASPVDYAAASKQVYGSHYYEASLGLTVLLRDPAAASPATYLVYVNRSRVDAFGGLFGGLVRKIVRSRARSTVSDLLAGIQDSLEEEYAASISESLEPDDLYQ